MEEYEVFIQEAPNKSSFLIKTMTLDKLFKFIIKKYKLLRKENNLFCLCYSYKIFKELFPEEKLTGIIQHRGIARTGWILTNTINLKNNLKIVSKTPYFFNFLIHYKTKQL